MTCGVNGFPIRKIKRMEKFNVSHCFASPFFVINKEGVLEELPLRNSLMDASHLFGMVRNCKSAVAFRSFPATFGSFGGFSLETSPEVFIFAGQLHPDFGNFFLLEDDNCQPVEISGDNMLSYLPSTVQCAILCCCNSENLGRVLSSRIPHVVAVRETDDVTDECLMAFTATFLEQLLQGRSVRGAFQLAQLVLEGKKYASNNLVLLPENRGHEEVLFSTTRMNNDSVLTKDEVTLCTMLCPEFPKNSISRHSEAIEAIYRELIHSSDHGVVVLVADKGFGATTTALQLIHRLAPRNWYQAIVFVCFDDVTLACKQDFVGHIARVLSPQFSVGGESLEIRDVVARLIGRGRCLLVLDGCNSSEDQEELWRECIEEIMVADPHLIVLLTTHSGRLQFSSMHCFLLNVMSDVEIAKIILRNSARPITPKEVVPNEKLRILSQSRLSKRSMIREFVKEFAESALVRSLGGNPTAAMLFSQRVRNDLLSSNSYDQELQACLNDAKVVKPTIPLLTRRLELYERSTATVPPIPRSSIVQLVSSPFINNSGAPLQPVNFQREVLAMESLLRDVLETEPSFRQGVADVSNLISTLSDPPDILFLSGHCFSKSSSWLLEDDFGGPLVVEPSKIFTTGEFSLAKVVIIGMAETDTMNQISQMFATNMISFDVNCFLVGGDKSVESFLRHFLKRLYDGETVSGSFVAAQEMTFGSESCNNVKLITCNENSRITVHSLSSTDSLKLVQKMPIFQFFPNIPPGFVAPSDSACLLCELHKCFVQHQRVVAHIEGVKGCGSTTTALRLAAHLCDRKVFTEVYFLPLSWYFLRRFHPNITSVEKVGDDFASFELPLHFTNEDGIARCESMSAFAERIKRSSRHSRILLILDGFSSSGLDHDEFERDRDEVVAFFKQLVLNCQIVSILTTTQEPLRFELTDVGVHQETVSLHMMSDEELAILLFKNNVRPLRVNEILSMKEYLGGVFQENSNDRLAQRLVSKLAASNIVVSLKGSPLAAMICCSLLGGAVWKDLEILEQVELAENACQDAKFLVLLMKYGNDAMWTTMAFAVQSKELTDSFTDVQFISIPAPFSSSGACEIEAGLVGTARISFEDMSKYEETMLLFQDIILCAKSLSRASYTLSRHVLSVKTGDERSIGCAIDESVCRQWSLSQLEETLRWYREMYDGITTEDCELCVKYFADHSFNESFWNQTNSVYDLMCKSRPDYQLNSNPVWATLSEFISALRAALKTVEINAVDFMSVSSSKDFTGLLPGKEKDIVSMEEGVMVSGKFVNGMAEQQKLVFLEIFSLVCEKFKRIGMGLARMVLDSITGSSIDELEETLNKDVIPNNIPIAMTGAAGNFLEHAAQVVNEVSTYYKMPLLPTFSPQVTWISEIIGCLKRILRFLSDEVDKLTTALVFVVRAVALIVAVLRWKIGKELEPLKARIAMFASKWRRRASGFGIVPGDIV